MSAFRFLSSSKKFLPDGRTRSDRTSLGIRTRMAIASWRFGLATAAIRRIQSGSAFDQLLQLIRVRCSLHRGLECDLAGMIERCQRLVKCLHTELFLTGLHHRIDLMD